MTNSTDYLNYLRSLIKIITNTLVIVFFFSLVSFNQTDDTLSNTNSQSDTVFVMEKSAWGAVLRSAVIPGWGQFYNESYWKFPIVWGVAGWFVYNWIDTNNKYLDNRDLFLGTNNSIYKNRRDFYRDERDKFAIYLTLTYLLNLVDAYVDAHLFDFNVEEDKMIGTMNLKFRYNF